MTGHHLILGELVDLITGESLPDTHDERYRQKIARLLLRQKDYRTEDIWPRHRILVKAGQKQALIPVDFIIRLNGLILMIIKYGPGSLVTRRRPALALSRLTAPYQIPIAVVTNGEQAEILDASSGNVIAEELDGIPSRTSLAQRLTQWCFPAISPRRLEMESRIAYAYEVDDSCPCDDTICRL
jgi:hypothetical protein